MSQESVTVSAELAREVLDLASNDWVPLAAVDGIARNHLGEDHRARKEAVYASLSELLGAGLIVAGEVVAGDGFRPWDLQVSETCQRLREVVFATDEGFWFGVWFDRAPVGDPRAPGLSAE